MGHPGWGEQKEIIVAMGRSIIKFASKFPDSLEVGHGFG